MSSHSARLGPVALPDFGMPSAQPVIPSSVHEARLDALRDRASRLGYDHVVVYADREHSANISYLTGFDPRFEEAVLVVGPASVPTVLVGNECEGMARNAPVGMDVRLYQELSLPGQPRDRSPELGQILAEAGISPGQSVGAIGWKTFRDPATLDIPMFLAVALSAAVGGNGKVENATTIMIDPDTGLRVVNEVEQIVSFEYAACHTSSGVRNLLSGLEPGMTEQEAVRLLGWNGAPLSCHLMLTAGDRARLGLLSPGDRPIEEGDPLTVAFGIWGALNCRAGFVVDTESALPATADDYIEKLVGPYFEAIVEWYEALHVGQTGGNLQEIIDRRLGDPFFGIFLNPGHLIHLDEWVSTPVWRGSTVELRSGMAMQVDVIPATGTDYFTTNIEDGIVLADSALRDRIARDHPDVWDRMTARRDFMRNALGIDLHDDVLPLSNIPAFLPPLLLDRERAMTTV
jgi:Creatinase/Prolidase N-terminal domain